MVEWINKKTIIISVLAIVVIGASWWIFLLGDPNDEEEGRENPLVVASEAIKKYGLVKGVGLGTKRIFKCHPFNPGGVDLP